MKFLIFFSGLSEDNEGNSMGLKISKERGGNYFKLIYPRFNNTWHHKKSLEQDLNLDYKKDKFRKNKKIEHLKDKGINFERMQRLVLITMASILHILGTLINKICSLSAKENI